MKAYIIGPAGSGKTTIAKLLSRKTKVDSTNLDDLFWINDKNCFGNKRIKEERTNLLSKVLERESWIIEGAYVEWPKQAIYEADFIIYMDFSLRILQFRILKRFILRKFGFEKANKKETIKGILELLKWNTDQANEIRILINELKSENKKVIQLKSKNEINKFINNSKYLEKDF